MDLSSNTKGTVLGEAIQLGIEALEALGIVREWLKKKKIYWEGVSKLPSETEEIERMRE